MKSKRQMCKFSLFFLTVLGISVYINMTVWTMSRTTRTRVGLHNLNGKEDVIPGVKLLDEEAKEAFTPQRRHNLLHRKQGEDLPVEGCREKTSFVFIKCMKCATETLATVFRRFGYFRKLSFLTPVKDKLYLGWPFLMNQHDYRPSSRGYSIIMEHSIFNKTIMDELMPKDTVYISIIREPFSHVKSTINYFKLMEVMNITAGDKLSEYFHNFEKYEAIYKSPEKHSPRFCVPDGFSMTKNLQAHCLGMPLGFPPGRGDISGDPEAVSRYIAHLGKSFYLIMLVEYFHESLVLLRRKMCWSHYDILYKPVNTLEYSYKGKSTNSDLEVLYKEWSKADYMIYDHFNKTFWEQVGKESSDFFEEVRVFSQIQERVTKFCDYGVPQKLYVNATTWSPGFSMVRENCKNLWPDLLKRIQKRHEKEEQSLLEKVHMGKDYIPKHQALC